MCRHSELMSRKLPQTIYCEQVPAIVTAEQPSITVSELLEAEDVTASSFSQIPGWETIAQHPVAGLQLRTSIEDELVTQTDQQIRAQLNQMLGLCPERPTVQVPVAVKAPVARQTVGVSC